MKKRLVKRRIIGDRRAYQNYGMHIPERRIGRRRKNNRREEKGGEK